MKFLSGRLVVTPGFAALLSASAYFGSLRLTGAFLLAAVYSILVAAGGLLPAPPVVPEGPMFVPELSQEQEERFAELRKACEVTPKS